MAERLVYVWRLVVTLPKGSDAPGWRPENFKDSYGHYADDDQKTFRWPRRRLYLSSSAAYHRAYLMRRWGATVEVQRSSPIDEWEPMYG